MKSISEVSSYPGQVESLSKYSWHAIGDYTTFNAKTHEWNSYCYFGGRYELTLVMQIKIDHAKNQITEVDDDPKFSLNVISSIEEDGHLISYGNSVKFGVKEWRECFVDRKDLKSMLKKLGIEHNDHKLEGFEKMASLMVPEGRNRITVGD